MRPLRLLEVIYRHWWTSHEYGRSEDSGFGAGLSTGNATTQLPPVVGHEAATVLLNSLKLTWGF